MDGRVLEEIFTQEYMSQNPVRSYDASGTVEPEKSVTLTEEESDEIRERLRSLGYLG
jgi:hypothetical protein